MIGKEIVRFHAIFWPAFLMAADLPLPKHIYAHGWLLFEHDKMSKSRGNIVRAEPIRRVMGADALRYFLLREIVFGQDGSFSYDALIGRYNSELANGLKSGEPHADDDSSISKRRHTRRLRRSNPEDRMRRHSRNRGSILPFRFFEGPGIDLVAALRRGQIYC